MKVNRIALVSLALGLAGVFALVNPTVSAQSQVAPETSPARQPEMKLNTSKYSARPPIGDSERRPNESAVQASGRAVMERRMGGPDWPGFFGRIEDPGPLVNGKGESTAVTIIDTMGDEAFPVAAQSVITGVVTGATAFLSPDRTYVYSDFNVRVESVMKQDSQQPVTAGDSVISFREGGSLRFPSGHITHFVIYGKGFPNVGGRYVFFLWRWEGLFGRYWIHAAYQIKEGTVFGLDDGGHYNGHNGMTEDAFLKEVRMFVSDHPAR